MVLAWPLIKDLLDFRERLNCLFDEAQLGEGPSISEPFSGPFCPTADLYETDTELVIILEIPGVEADTIELRIQGESLRVAGRIRPRDGAAAGRYLRMDLEGSVMGQPMRGMGITGFDRFRKHYTMYWIDSMSTTMIMSSGNFDPSGKILTMYGTMDEPMTGEIGKHVKYVTRIVDEYKHIFEIHDLIHGEGSTLVLEISYTRK